MIFPNPTMAGFRAATDSVMGFMQVFLSLEMKRPTHRVEGM